MQAYVFTLLSAVFIGMAIHVITDFCVLTDYELRQTLTTEGETTWVANAIAFFGAGLGLGMVVIGAGLASAVWRPAQPEGIARQPSAADKITGAVNLPLFLLEGVAILAEVFALLIVLMKQ